MLCELQVDAIVAAVDREVDQLYDDPSIDPNYLDIDRNATDGQCSVRLSDEASRWLYRYLEDGGFPEDSGQPRSVRVELDADGGGRRVDRDEIEQLLQDPETFEIERGARSNLPPGVYRDNGQSLDMLVAHLDPDTYQRSFDWGLITARAAEQAVADFYRRRR